MAALDNLFSKLASALLTAFGVAGSITRSADSHDPATGSITTTTTTTAVKASPLSDYTVEFKEAQAELKTTSWTIIAARNLTIVPTPATDRYVIGSVNLRIIRADPLYSGANVAAFVLHLKE